MSLARGVWSGPILDNHFHLNRGGLFLGAVEQFQRAGGTDLVLVHCPDFTSPPTTKDGHRESYADTVAIAGEVHAAHGIEPRVVLGPHPAAFAHQFSGWLEQEGEKGAQRAIENYHDSIDAAVEFIEEGEACAIGEVGRPHWKVSERVWELSNSLLEETMSTALRTGIPLQLHMEEAGAETYSDLEAMAARAGLDPERLVRHFAPPDVSSKMAGQVTPSVNLRKEGIETLLETQAESAHGFMLETDYMDDPRRPGAVLGPKVVPRRTQQLASLSEQAGLDEEFFYSMHVGLPNRIYGESG